MSVLPPSTRPRKKVRWVVFWIVVAVLTVSFAILVWEKFFHEVPQKFASLEERFKYGSIGTENEQGIPYWIWVVLPRVFPENLPGPGGYSSLGLAWEEGQEVPVGFSKKRIGYERVAFNCAVCHTGTYRVLREDGRPSKTVVVPAALTAYAMFGWGSYSNWIGSAASAQARQPALDYDEVDAWAGEQRDRLADGRRMATARHWRDEHPRLTTGARVVRRPRESGPPSGALLPARPELRQVGVEGCRRSPALRGVAAIVTGRRARAAEARAGDGHAAAPGTP